MKTLLSQRTKTILIPGPCGNIEALVSESKNSNEYAVICHPHPLHGGSMHNKVVTTIAKALDKHNINTIRFNYRGVGDSNGSYDNGVGEINDLMAVYSWGKKYFEEKSCLLAGFSFGSYICAAATKEIKPIALITLAPAISSQDYKNIPNHLCPWLFVQGEKDEVVDANKGIAWAKQHPNKPQIKLMADTSHFFHGKLQQLEEIIIAFIEGEITQNDN